MMRWKEAPFWRLQMLPLLDRRPNPLSKTGAQGKGHMRGPTVDMLLLAHPALDTVPKQGLEDALEKDLVILPALCPAVQSRTPVPLGLALDHARQQRKGIVTVTLRAVQAPHPVPPLGSLALCPVPLQGGGGTPILPLVLALGVAPGRVLNPLKDEHSGVEAEDYTVLHIGQAMATNQRQTQKR